MRARIVSGLVLMMAIAYLAGCSSVRNYSPSQIGRDGWALESGHSSIGLHLERGSDDIWIKPHLPNAFVVKLTPGGVWIPTYPGSERTSTSSRVLWGYAYYSIPEGKTFEDVYTWYFNWYAFGKETNEAVVEGWREGDSELYKSIEFKRGTEWVELTQGARENEYTLTVNPPRVAVPVYPGAREFSLNASGSEQIRSYVLPQGVTFKQVYEWYRRTLTGK
jgi:hypothetical protein